MFSFFKKAPPPPAPAAEAPALLPEGWVTKPASKPAPAPEPAAPPTVVPESSPVVAPTVAPAAAPAALSTPVPAAVPVAPPAVVLPPAVPLPAPAPVPAPPTAVAPITAPAPAPRQSWMERLRAGLRRTGGSIASVFSATKIDEQLYEELEEALLLADAGVKATQFLLDDLKRRVKEARTTDPQAVRGLLIDALAELLSPLEKGLEVGRFTPTVMMVVGVNGAGKTTSIGKLTRHLADADQRVLLAAADTFRAAAREQLGVWADRAQVEIISQEGGDPAAVSFDAVNAGRARGADVVIADTAGRLPTQLHLMEELKKIKRVITKAQDGAPHEVLLVVDGNTGQNALNQVKAFDEALGLTGLIVTKLDGTAKGGVLAAIARERPVPVYFVGVGEKLEDLETFSAREFARALLE
ncbi:signal recognition particle-docking protein FtsY [Roseateles puraquae]|uniref:Signal recognition particle receptor FtsY n=1 Tax=Roseateles puraquae TaxID=431059 RepID=A0A254NDC0_9BURK|nr:signal recognition particle-docking protein FtsY [Roseateles puraquae]MDG0857597.1 signal recognition particle-docking protein FtsY [Roseateles puraquae]OWR05951.1 signal recognition particle-docking protein FtsY [Roseateles puraquae]